MTNTTVEPRIAMRLGTTASFGLLVSTSVAYATQAVNSTEGLIAQTSAAAMVALSGTIALGALAAAMHTGRSRQGYVALAVGVGALGMQAINAVGYWESKDAGIQQAKANLSEAVKVSGAFVPTASQPIKTRISMLVEEGGPQERRSIRAQRRALGEKLAEAQQSEAMATSLRVRVSEAQGNLAAAKSEAGFGVWARTIVLTAIEALGPAAMALSAKGKLAPQPQPAPTQQPSAPISAGAALARRRWDAKALAKADPINGMPV